MAKFIIIGLIIILICFLIYLAYQTIVVFDTKSLFPFVAFAFTVILAGVTYYTSLMSGKQTDQIQTAVNNTDTTLTQYLSENTMEGQIFFDSNAIHLGPKDWVHMRLGGPLISLTAETINNAQPIGLANGTQPIKWEIQNGNLYISAKCYDINNHLIVELTKNYWRRNPNYTSKFNYDNRGFEVIDNQGNVALSVDLQENNTILVQGYFISPGENTVVYCGAAQMIIDRYDRAQDPNIFNTYIKSIGIKYLFKYDQIHYMGVRNR